MSCTNYLAILIDQRMSDLRLSKHALVTKLGYKNAGKGLNRLEQVYRRDFSRAEFLLERLPQALQVDASEISAARERTLQEAASRAQELEMRRFRPHAIFLTEHRVPLQIVIAAMMGADRQRYIFFDYKTDPFSFKSIVLKAAPSTIPTFGKVLGFVINYSPTYAIEYDIYGTVKMVCSNSKSVGYIRLGF